MTDSIVKKEGGPPPDKKSHPNSRNNHKRNGTLKQTKFVEICTALEDHIYNCSGVGQAEQYTKTIERIAEYVDHEYSMGLLVRTYIEILTPVTTTTPKDLNDTATKIEMFLWQIKVKLYTRKQEQLKENLKNA